MKNTYYIPAILFFLISSTTLLFAQKSVYSFPFENNYKLPPMETFINADEISATYQTIGNLYTTEIIGLGDETMEQTSSIYISDVKAMDAIRFLEFYMEDQLIAPGDETSGAAEMSIIYFNSKSRANLGTAFVVLTLGLGVLFGIPYSTSITDVEVEAKFLDNSKMHIATHRGTGRAKVIETIYNLNFDKRSQHQKALKRAISDLNEQIMSDPTLAKEAS